MNSNIDPELKARNRRTALMLAGVAALFFFGFILAGVLRA